MNDFRSTEDIVKVERLENKELLHEYFLLDLALVLIDSIDQVPPFNSFLFISVLFKVKAARAAGVVLNSFEGDGGVGGGGSSGGEEVSKILEEARAKYGRVIIFLRGRIMNLRRLKVG